MELLTNYRDIDIDRKIEVVPISGVTNVQFTVSMDNYADKMTSCTADPFESSLAYITPDSVHHPVDEEGNGITVAT